MIAVVTIKTVTIKHCGRLLPVTALIIGGVGGLGEGAGGGGGGAESPADKSVSRH